MPPTPATIRAAGLILGVLLDRVLGDPARWHPVAGYGRFAAALERRIYGNGILRGALYAGLALVPPVLTGVLAERTARHSRVLGVTLTGLSTWLVLGGAGLAREGVEMAAALEGGQLAVARRRLSHLCARDAADLDADDLARATVESLAENASDAVVAPLVWGALFGIPGLLGYRAVNTLDAMVGYRSARYELFGRVAARTDDVANLVPARLTGLLVALCAPIVGGSTRVSLAVLTRDGDRHPSPNAGRPEAAAAGALGVRLGGASRYHGRAEYRPTLGEPGRAPGPADVRRAVRLGRAVTAAGTAAAVLLAWGADGVPTGRSGPRRAASPRP